MVSIQSVIDACKAAPHHRVVCGNLEISGVKAHTKWTFGYIVRRTRKDGRTRVSLGKKNAIAYLETEGDMPIVPITFSECVGPLNTAVFDDEAPSDEQPAAPRERETVVLNNFMAHGVPVRMDSASARECMVRYNRERSQALRRQYKSSEKARTVRAHFAFNLACNLACDETTYEYSRIVADAFARFHYHQFCQNKHSPFSAREVWRAAWCVARRMARRNGRSDDL